MAGFVHKCPCLKPQIDDDVRVLDYRHCSLADVPGEVFNFERTLEELFADSNQIRDLPRELFYCHGLRKLTISDNEITNIPPAIASLVNLEEFDFSKNGVIDVPDNIKACKQLQHIDASVNPLGKLPEGFTQLQNLTQLFLNDTFLDYLPGSFGRLNKLKILEIRENHLRTLPRSFSRLSELERLDIGNNEFQELPDVVGYLTSLLELWCDHNQITHLTAAIGNLKQLIFLDASKNRLECLPTEIEGCSCLADLHLTSNNLQSLPETLGNLNHLTTLKVDDNQLVSLPRSLGGLSSLSELNASANDLESLPSSIGLLRNLRTFYADENFLEFLPAELGSCSGITVLSLRSNKLSYIPDELGRIPKLRVLNLSDNRLQYLPFTIVKLKELQALWLTENQTRPLIPLQSDYEPHTGRKILTCYLLPQQLDSPDGGEDMGGDTDSFHASIWEEERRQRQQIQFEVDDVDADGVLLRCPTPYPKEMREQARHARNLALRQRVAPPGDNQWLRGTENMGYEEEEKQMKDKARMQQRHSPERSGETIGLVSPRSNKKDKNGKSQDLSLSASVDKRSPSPKKGSKHSAIHNDENGFSRTPSSDILSASDTRSIVSEPQGGTGMKQSQSTYTSSLWGADSLYYHHHPRGRHHSHRRMRDYDSDTGYRSDQELMRFRRQFLTEQQGEMSSNMSRHPNRGSHTQGRDGGYASDLEAYVSRTRGAAYRNPNLAQQLPAHSLPQNLNASSHGSRPHSDIVRPSPSSQFRQQEPPSGEPYSVKVQRPNKTETTSANPLPTPSPSLFHRNKFVDQSTPVPTEQKQFVLAPPGDGSTASNSDWRNELYAVLEKRMHRKSSESSGTNVQSGSDPTYSDSKYHPPPYQPAPPYRKSPERTPSDATEHSHPDAQRDNIYESNPPSTDINTTPRSHRDYERLPAARSSLPEVASASRIPKNYERLPESGSYSVSNAGTPRIHKDYKRLPDRTPPPGTSHRDQIPRHYGGDRSTFREYTPERESSYPGSRSRTPVTQVQDRCERVQGSPRSDSDTGSVRKRSNSRTSNCEINPDSSRLYESYPNQFSEPEEAHNPVMSSYEDVAMFKSEPPSQVSSSTDSGYGHSHHIYEKIGDFSGRYPGNQHSSSTPPPHQPVLRRNNSTSRETTPIQEESVYGGIGQQLNSSVYDSGGSIQQTFQVTINKNPGLGFSIAGGIGSYGNPFRDGDTGIFVTKVQPGGPAAMTLRPGDKILNVNGVDFTNIQHSQAVSVMKFNTTVSMCVERLEKVNIV